MGAVPSPRYVTSASLKFLRIIIIKSIVAHFKYRDDGFIAMKTTETEKMQLFKLANHEHKYLGFTYNIHLFYEAVFLDTYVLKGQRFN